MPELIGEAAAGRKQHEHEYLYWEISGWTAIRQGTLARRASQAQRTWELYDLATDPSESKDVAAVQPEMLGKLTALAAKAHEPVREGRSPEPIVTSATGELNSANTMSQILRNRRPKRRAKGKERRRAKPMQTKLVETCFVPFVLPPGTALARAGHTGRPLRRSRIRYTWFRELIRIIEMHRENTILSKTAVACRELAFAFSVATGKSMAAYSPFF